MKTKLIGAHVTAQQMDVKTGKSKKPSSREKIFIQGHFKHCKTAFQIKLMYEAFWNTVAVSTFVNVMKVEPIYQTEERMLIQLLKIGDKFRYRLDRTTYIYKGKRSGSNGCYIAVPEFGSTRRVFGRDELVTKILISDLK